jgi:hypothetical protein
MDPWTFYPYPNAILRNSKYVYVQVDEYRKFSDASVGEYVRKRCAHTSESVTELVIKAEVFKKYRAQESTRGENTNDVPVKDKRAKEKRRGLTGHNFTMGYMTTKSCEVDVRLSSGVHISHLRKFEADYRISSPKVSTPHVLLSAMTLGTPPPPPPSLSWLNFWIIMFLKTSYERLCGWVVTLARDPGHQS